MKLHQWEQIDREQMNALVARKVIHTENMTVARIFLKRGAKVPSHSHANEQVTLLESGSILFSVAGSDQVLLPGQVMQVPPGAPHHVEALEDSVALDLFVPRREDWIRGDDAYLR